MFANQQSDEAFGLLLVSGLFFVVFLVMYRRKRLGTGTEFGNAAWMTDEELRKYGMLGNVGLVLAKTAKGLIRIPSYCHVLLCGGTGSGKGVSIILTNLIDYARGSVVCFDVKGDLYETTAERRQKEKSQRIIRLAPFSNSSDQFNPLDTIKKGDALLVDKAKAMSEALVVRDGTERDPYWSNRAVQVISAIMVFVLIRLEGVERSLNTVKDIASDLMKLYGVAEQLQTMGRIPANMGSSIKTMFERPPGVSKEDETIIPPLLSKEGAGVMSTVGTHLSFLDSEPVANSLASSTWEVQCLLESGVTLYLQIPPSQLEAQRGWLRCIVSTLIREIGSSGREESSEVLFLIDEASALGSLSSIEEACVRGRSAGVRLLLAYQSDSQITTAFKDKPTLLYDNCSAQIYLCPPGSYETAERISKMCGTYTQIVEGDGTNKGSSQSYDPQGQRSSSHDGGASMSRALQERLLLRPEEVLTLHPDLLIAFVRGLPGPILAQRIKWYEDPRFNPALHNKGDRWGKVRRDMVILFLLACIILAVVWFENH